LLLAGIAPAQTSPPAPPTLTGFSADPSPITVPNTSTLTATLNRDPANTGYWTVIVDDDTGQVVRQCNTGTICKAEVTAGWPMNKDAKPLHYHAEVRSNGGVVSRSDQVTLEVRRFEYDVSLTADLNPVTVPNTSTLTATLNRDPANTGYWTVIVDDDTGQVVRQCNTGATCKAEVTAGWPMNKDAKPLHYHAEVRSSNDVAGRSGQETLEVRRQLFDVTLAFSERSMRTDGAWWTARAAATPALYGTPYGLKIEKADGSTVVSCNPGVGCSGSVKEGGTYRATIEDAQGFSFGRSPSLTITADGPKEESALDLDLVALAARFAGPGAVCEALLTIPGTHLRGASVTDQYLACEAAVAAGLATAAVLAAVAAEDNGTDSLWGLFDQIAPDPSQPRPVGPVGDIFQDETGQLSRRLLAQNATLTQREADAVADRCLRLTARVPRNGDRDCSTLPIFASGADVPEPTDHDLRALRSRPVWVGLNYQPRSEKRQYEGWQNDEPECPRGSRPPGQQCDEYPFFATAQGGPLAPLRPDLEFLDGAQNGLQGTRYGQFLSSCSIASGDRFLGVPLPSELGLPTQTKICNRAGAP